MEKEIKINGYWCKFIDNAKAPECEFLCIPIVHDVKYVKSWATLSFNPDEKETFGKRIHILDSRIIPSTVPSKSLSIFVFTYQEDVDIEFIKCRAQFFFREGKSPEVEPSDDTAEYAIIKSVDKNALEVVKLIYSFAKISIKDAKQLIDLVQKGFYQKLQLNHMSTDDRRFLLSQFRENNVKFILK